MAAPRIDDIVEAAGRISGLAATTPLIPSFGLGRLLDADVRLKLECVQPTRSFKVRGAANVVGARADRIDPSRGVVAYSTGNHGRAVAWVAAQVGVPATVCMSRNTTDDKREALRSMGATVRVVGDSQDEAAELAREMAADGYLMVDPINDPLTTAGQGTIGLEITRQWPDVDTVVVPVSGGALMAGIALAVTSALPNVRLVGVSMADGAAMHASLAAGRPVVVEEAPSLADSLQGGITPDNDHSFAVVRDLVDEVVLVDEDAIAFAMAEAVVEERLVLEGAGATPIAALLEHDRSRFGDRIALVASGAMVDAAVLRSVVGDHLDAVRSRFGVSR